MHLLPEVRQLNVKEIAQAEMHPHKSLNKTFPGRPIIAQSGSPTYYFGKIKNVFLLPVVKEQNTHMGQAALHATHRITSGFF